MPFEYLTERQRHIYAFIRTNGARRPHSLHYKPFEKDVSCDAIEADMETMIRKGWLRTVGRPETSTEHRYDIPEDDRESYVTPQQRELQERIVECEPFDPADVAISPSLLSE